MNSAQKLHLSTANPKGDRFVIVRPQINGSELAQKRLTGLMMRDSVCVTKINNIFLMFVVGVYQTK